MYSNCGSSYVVVTDADAASVVIDRAYLLNLQRLCCAYSKINVADADGANFLSNAML